MADARERTFHEIVDRGRARFARVARAYAPGTDAQDLYQDIYRLLRSVWWWYIGPNLVGVILFFFGGRLSLVPTLGLVAAAAVAGVVFWLNQVAAREGVLPLRDEVARLLRELDAEAS